MQMRRYMPILELQWPWGNQCEQHCLFLWWLSENEDSRRTEPDKVWMSWRRRRSLKALDSPRTRVETQSRMAGRVWTPSFLLAGVKLTKTTNQGGKDGGQPYSLSPYKIMQPGHHVFSPFSGCPVLVLWRTWIFSTRWNREKHRLKFCFVLFFNTTLIKFLLDIFWCLRASIPRTLGKFDTQCFLI